jgi:predicted unusual protein kinase regulating ubiquinone biosynthesis (AarF/ABC1/UbiB family)
MTSLNPARLKRYKDIARLLLKYGRSDLVKQAALADVLPDPGGIEPEDEPSDADGLARDLEALGPTFIKLGQVLSTRADLLPIAYLEALSRLQDRCEPFPYEDAERIVQEELGVRISKAFSRFEPVPLAAASLGQVHAAELRDGRAVAVKVQRPGIREEIVEDLAALDDIAGIMSERTDWGRRYDVAGVVTEFRRILLRELDYRLEANNMVSLRRNLAGIDRIVVPAPIDDYTTDRILTMDFIRGRKVTEISPLRSLELDSQPLADALFQAYLKQILVDGLFHADPHPGNVFLTDDDRIALLDLGMVSRVSPDMREKLLRLLLAVSEGRGDEAADLSVAIGEKMGGDGMDPQSFRREIVALVGEHEGLPVREINVGMLVVRLSRIAADSGVRMPRELTMLGKALLNLDAVARALAPDFDPNAAVRRRAAEIASRQMKAQLSPGNLLAAAMETAELVQKLPGRVNRILDRLTDEQLRLGVDVIDEVTLVEGFQKVANRIATGLVVAALIVGAAMLMGVETEFRIFGYPGLAMVCFAGAVGVGVWLLYDILAHDRKGRSRDKSR